MISRSTLSLISWKFSPALFLFIFSTVTHAEYKVKITPDIPYLDVQHNGNTVRIERNQDTNNRLINGFSKTSRPCPPFCVYPIEVDPGVKTVGEVELLRFLENEVKNNKGLLIDTRMPVWFEKGTIPGSVNIPFTLLIEGQENEHVVKILRLLGATEKNNKWNYDNARDLMLFCNGPWCGMSVRAIKSMVKMGYPKEKLFWYRSGMQAWQQLGLTTVTP